MIPNADDREACRQRPDEPLVMHQRWQRLLFLHWRYPAEVIQQTLPAGLTVDTFDGSAWMGVVPFTMSGIRPRFLPAVPGISAFPELNLRTYVVGPDGVPGVWFYSLDAAGWLGVKIARALFHLPYFHAEMSAAQQENAGTIEYRCHRKGADPALASSFAYVGESAPFAAEAGSLEYFLAERYVLYSHNPKTNTLYRGRVHHPPYPLQTARVDRWDANLFALDGFAPEERPFEHALYAEGVEVEVFPLRRVPQATD